MNSGERYEQARRLIKSNQLQKARKLLLPIRHEDKAADWIQKIDTHLARKKQLVKSSSRSPSWITIAVTAFLAMLTFVIGLVVGGYALDWNADPTPEPVQNVVVITATPLPATNTSIPTATPFPTETPRSTPPPIATETPLPKIGKWELGSDVSALDDTTSHFIFLEAETSVNAWLDNPIPALVIRCENRQYDVYIFADSQLESTLDDEVFTRVRYGDNSPVNLTMSESTTGEAMFFPDGETAVRNLLPVNRLVVGYTPFNANPVEAVFDLTGIEEAIQPLFDACGRP